MSFTGILSIALGAILVENFIFSQFLGICPFMGVSKKMDTAAGMGIAVTFVMGVASIFTYLINLVLVKLGLEFMQTVAYILVIASLVQFVEMFLQKAMPSSRRSFSKRRRFSESTSAESSATKLPLPTAVTINPLRSSSSHARFTEITLTLSSSAAVRIGGKASPGASSPLITAREMPSHICR